MYTAMFVPEVVKDQYTIKSIYLKRDVELEILTPAGLLGNEEVGLLVLNDGQDVIELQVEETLNLLYAKGKTGPVVVVAVKSGANRLQEYGVAGEPDFLGRGSKAAEYTRFMMEELLPFVNKTIKIPFNSKRALAGSSLGGLSAFDIAWNNEHAFDTVGVFSGSFWWRKKDLKDAYTDNDRIMHQVIRETSGKPALKFWLMTGTEDETADRNRNFIIDSIDDTIDIIKELLHKGYTRPDDVFYYEMVGGQHNVASWAKAFPAFLAWTFSIK
ncbi:alpha/beta hydrolase [Pedobacter metabolipauper]|uniref:Enterochelin esterase-like enzyme n=1 Tax=Pedobacter metabolipauper TaxID=425513 RepID=A0A4R6SYS1_9SPHI|nr:alpha/beta hydrolase-fold protein [Pedobacter metabolipauper]TDQ09834.1 enterochelin esterase-like enzyme [Pedobacter metabolipauper]